MNPTNLIMRTPRLFMAAAGAAALFALTLGAQETDPELMQQRHVFTSQVTRTVNLGYLLYLPKDYASEATKRWPLLLFLHGAGERGHDLAKVAVHGPPKLVKQNREFPFLIVSPQCPAGQRWDNTVLLALLDDVIARYKVDPKRIYLTGLSMGGYGTWSLGSTSPERFAAIAPICGGGETIDVLLANPDKVRAIQSLGVWAFHGAKDSVVPLAESERMIAAFQRAGCKEIELTVYPEADHDSWSETYNQPKLYDWLLKHQR